MEALDPPAGITGRQTIWKLWHHFDVDAELGVAASVFDLKSIEWKGDGDAQIRQTMHIWRTAKRRIRDPGDGSFTQCFRDMLRQSKLPPFQMALLEFDRIPHNPDVPGGRG